jgi:hypothetical protein
VEPRQDSDVTGGGLYLFTLTAAGRTTIWRAAYIEGNPHRRHLDFQYFFEMALHLEPFGL